MSPKGWALPKELEAYKKKKVVAPLPRPDSPKEFCEQINNINPKMAVGEGFFHRNACGRTYTEQINDLQEIG